MRTTYIIPYRWEACRKHKQTYQSTGVENLRTKQDHTVFIQTHMDEQFYPNMWHNQTKNCKLSITSVIALTQNYLLKKQIYTSGTFEHPQTRKCCPKLSQQCAYKIQKTIFMERNYLYRHKIQCRHGTKHMKTPKTHSTSWSMLT